MSDPMKKNAQRVPQPFDNNPIRVVPPTDYPDCILRPWQAKDSTGRTVTHRVSGIRRSWPLPSISKGPIWGTEAQKKKGVAGA